MRNLIVAVTLLLAGCSATQDELRRDGRRFQVSSVRTPLGAAGCVARNIEASGLKTSIGETADFAGVFQVTARNPNSSGIVMSARAEPILKGSIIILWISSTQTNPEGAFADAVKGC